MIKTVHKKPSDYIGRLEEMILAYLLQSPNEEAIVSDVKKHLDAFTGSTNWIGALYRTIERMVEKGLLSSRVILPNGNPASRSTMCFKVTDIGKEEVEKVIALHKDLWRLYLIKAKYQRPVGENHA